MLSFRIALLSDGKSSFPPKLHESDQASQSDGHQEADQHEQKQTPLPGPRQPPRQVEREILGVWLGAQCCKRLSKQNGVQLVWSLGNPGAQAFADLTAVQ